MNTAKENLGDTLQNLFSQVSTLSILEDQNLIAKSNCIKITIYDY